ncbi:MAG: hypothetical protein ACW99A_11140 [Candidatus Kariarchaeaceae archaeon]|jgi:hypothetical protein
MVSSSEVITGNLSEEDINENTRKIIAYITWFVIIFIPAYSVTDTNLKYYGPITEKAYIWPWMILTHYTPRDIYTSDQYAVVGFPWSIIIFIPFIYAIKSTWQIYISNENRAMHSAQIAVASVIQYFLLFMTFKSQSTDETVVTEEVSKYLIPQIILIVLHGFFASKWFYESINIKPK